MATPIVPAERGYLFPPPTYTIGGFSFFEGVPVRTEFSTISIRPADYGFIDDATPVTVSVSQYTTAENQAAITSSIPTSIAAIDSFTISFRCNEWPYYGNYNFDLNGGSLSASSGSVSVILSQYGVSYELFGSYYRRSPVDNGPTYGGVSFSDTLYDAEPNTSYEFGTSIRDSGWNNNTFYNAFNTDFSWTMSTTGLAVSDWNSPRTYYGTDTVILNAKTPAVYSTSAVLTIRGTRNFNSEDFAGQSMSDGQPLSITFEKTIPITTDDSPNVRAPKLFEFDTSWNNAGNVLVSPVGIGTNSDAYGNILVTGGETVQLIGSRKIAVVCDNDLTNETATIGFYVNGILKIDNDVTTITLPNGQVGKSISVMQGDLVTPIVRSCRYDENNPSSSENYRNFRIIAYKATISSNPATWVPANWNNTSPAVFKVYTATPQRWPNSWFNISSLTFGNRSPAIPPGEEVLIASMANLSTNEGETDSIHSYIKLTTIPNGYSDVKLRVYDGTTLLMEGTFVAIQNGQKLCLYTKYPSSYGQTITYNMAVGCSSSGSTNNTKNIALIIGTRNQDTSPIWTGIVDTINLEPEENNDIVFSATDFDGPLTYTITPADNNWNGWSSLNTTGIINPADGNHVFTIKPPKVYATAKSFKIRTSPGDASQTFVLSTRATSNTIVAAGEFLTITNAVPNEHFTSSAVKLWKFDSPQTVILDSGISMEYKLPGGNTWNNVSGSVFVVSPKTQVRLNANSQSKYNQSTSYKLRQQFSVGNYGNPLGGVWTIINNPEPTVTIANVTNAEPGETITVSAVVTNMGFYLQYGFSLNNYNLSDWWGCVGYGDVQNGDTITAQITLPPPNRLASFGETATFQLLLRPPSWDTFIPRRGDSSIHLFSVTTRNIQTEIPDLSEEFTDVTLATPGDIVYAYTILLTGFDLNQTISMENGFIIKNGVTASANDPSVTEVRAGDRIRIYMYAASDFSDEKIGILRQGTRELATWKVTNKPCDDLRLLTEF